MFAYASDIKNCEIIKRGSNGQFRWKFALLEQFVRAKSSANQFVLRAVRERLAYYKIVVQKWWNIF